MIQPARPFDRMRRVLLVACAAAFTGHTAGRGE
jgi:hypothetical protein